MIIQVDLFPSFHCVALTFSDQHMILAADEGLYTLNLNQIHDGTLELVSQRHQLPDCI